MVVLSSCKKNNDNQTTSNSEDTSTPAYYTFSGQIGTNDNSTLIAFDSSVIICGNNDTNISILKISKSGNQIWRKDIYAGNNCRASAITESSNHELYICGRTSRNYSTSSWDILLVKTDATGDTLWTKTFGSKQEDYGYQIIRTQDGNLLIGGISYRDTTSVFCDIYLIKVNPDGDTLWTQSYTEPEQQDPFHLMETQNGEYLITGTNEDNSPTGRKLLFLKLNANGTLLWEKTIGPVWKWGYSTIELSNGDLVTCGQYNPGGYTNVMIIKTDNQGNVIWENEFGLNNLSESGNSIKQNADGSFIITGSSYDAASMQADIILLKVDANGNQLFLKKFGSSISDNGVNVIKDNNDDNIITGNYNGSIFMTRTDNNGKFK